MTAESAQPRKHSNVTRPFPSQWVGSGDETTSGFAHGIGAFTAIIPGHPVDNYYNIIMHTVELYLTTRHHNNGLAQ